jgi:hypothetical protein
VDLSFSKTVILAGDFQLAEQVCSRLRKPGVYLPLIEAPCVRLFHFNKNCIFVGNAIRALRPKTLIFLKVLPEVVAKMRELFPDLNPLLIEQFDENLLGKHLELNRKPVGLEDLKQSLSSVFTGNLFVVEGESNINSIIAANLSIAHGGRVLSIPEVSEDEIDSLKEEFREWSNSKQTLEADQCRDRVLDFLKSRLPTGFIAASGVNSVSFVTRGVPYGMLPFNCPTTHYFSFSLLGLNVLTGMLKSQENFRCPVAVLIDPALVGVSEFEKLRQIFGKAGYYLRNAFKEAATIKAATYLVEHLPSDFIFFSTHCDEVKGKRILEKYPDADGKEHTICYDFTVSFSYNATSNLVETLEFHSPVSLDGISWRDKEKKKTINAGKLMADFIQYNRAKEKLPDERQYLSITDCDKIRHSSALGMSDGNYFPMPQVVGSYHYPLVFNNACSSWHTLATNFGCGHTSIYIGTSINILDSIAFDVATKFSHAITSGKDVGISLFRAQKDYIAKFGYAPYLMHGYLYMKLKNPNDGQRQARVLQRLEYGIHANEQIGNGNQDAAVFLKQELNSFQNRNTAVR